MITTKSLRLPSPLWFTVCSTQAKLNVSINHSLRQAGGLGSHAEIFFQSLGFIIETPLQMHFMSLHLLFVHSINLGYLYIPGMDMVIGFIFSIPLLSDGRMENLSKEQHWSNQTAVGSLSFLLVEIHSRFVDGSSTQMAVLSNLNCHEHSSSMHVISPTTNIIKVHWSETSLCLILLFTSKTFPGLRKSTY